MELSSIVATVLASICCFAHVGWCVPFFPIYPETQIEEPNQYANAQEEPVEYNADTPVWLIKESQHVQVPSNRQPNERYIPSYMRMVPGGWREISGLQSSTLHGGVPEKIYKPIGQNKVFDGQATMIPYTTEDFAQVGNAPKTYLGYWEMGSDEGHKIPQAETARGNTRIVSSDSDTDRMPNIPGIGKESTDEGPGRGGAGYPRGGGESDGYYPGAGEAGGGTGGTGGGGGGAGGAGGGGGGTGGARGGGGGAGGNGGSNGGVGGGNGAGGAGGAGGGNGGVPGNPSVGGGGAGAGPNTPGGGGGAGGGGAGGGGRGGAGGYPAYDPNNPNGPNVPVADPRGVPNYPSGGGGGGGAGGPRYPSNGPTYPGSGPGYPGKGPGYPGSGPGYPGSGPGYPSGGGGNGGPGMGGNPGRPGRPTMPILPVDRVVPDPRNGGGIPGGVPPPRVQPSVPGATIGPMVNQAMKGDISKLTVAGAVVGSLFLVGGLVVGGAVAGVAVQRWRRRRNMQKPGEYENIRMSTVSASV